MWPPAVVDKDPDSEAQPSGAFSEEGIYHFENGLRADGRFLRKACPKQGRKAEQSSMDRDLADFEPFPYPSDDGLNHVNGFETFLVDDRFDGSYAVPPVRDDGIGQLVVDPCTAGVLAFQSPDHECLMVSLEINNASVPRPDHLHWRLADGTVTLLRALHKKGQVQCSLQSKNLLQ